MTSLTRGFGLSSVVEELTMESNPARFHPPKCVTISPSAGASIHRIMAEGFCHPHPCNAAQQVQLRAQILVFSSLMKSSLPKKSLMNIAFSDLSKATRLEDFQENLFLKGKRKWEKLWTVASKQNNTATSSLPVAPGQTKKGSQDKSFPPKPKNSSRCMKKSSASGSIIVANMTIEAGKLMHDHKKAEQTSCADSVMHDDQKEDRTPETPCPDIVMHEHKKEGTILSLISRADNSPIENQDTCNMGSIRPVSEMKPFETNKIADVVPLNVSALQSTPVQPLNIGSSLPSQIGDTHNPCSSPISETNKIACIDTPLSETSNIASVASLNVPPSQPMLVQPLHIRPSLLPEIKDTNNRCSSQTSEASKMTSAALLNVPLPQSTPEQPLNIGSLLPSQFSDIQDPCSSQTSSPDKMTSAGPVSVSQSMQQPLNIRFSLPSSISDIQDPCSSHICQPTAQASQCMTTLAKESEAITFFACIPYPQHGLQFSSLPFLYPGCWTPYSSTQQVEVGTIPFTYSSHDCTGSNRDVDNVKRSDVHPDWKDVKTESIEEKIPVKNIPIHEPLPIESATFGDKEAWDNLFKLLTSMENLGPELEQAKLDVETAVATAQKAYDNTWASLGQINGINEQTSVQEDDDIKRGYINAISDAASYALAAAKSAFDSALRVQQIVNEALLRLCPKNNSCSKSLFSDGTGNACQTDVGGSIIDKDGGSLPGSLAVTREELKSSAHVGQPGISNLDSKVFLGLQTKEDVALAPGAAAEKFIESPQFVKGDVVEVLSDEDGLPGVWFSAKVIDISDGKALVSYEHLLAVGGQHHLEELVPIQAFCRGVPKIRVAHEIRKPDDQKRKWIIGEQVDGWIYDGWWAGKVVSLDGGGQNVTVHFLGDGQTHTLSSWELRTSLVWTGNRWVPSKDILQTASQSKKNCSLGKRKAKSSQRENLDRASKIAAVDAAKLENQHIQSEIISVKDTGIISSPVKLSMRKFKEVARGKQKLELCK